MSGLRACIAHLAGPFAGRSGEIAELRAAVDRVEARQQATIDELRSAVDDLSARIGALAAAGEARASDDG